MGVRMMGRADFCKLAGLDVEQYNSLSRRGQVPLVPNLDLPEEIANERGYSATGALILTIANELSDRYEMSRDRAAQIAMLSLNVFARWTDIAETSAQVAAGKMPATDILFAAIEWPDMRPKKGDRRPKCAVGTLKEIAAKHPNTSGVIAVSVTRCAALLRQRAAQARIDLGDFWER